MGKQYDKVQKRRRTEARLKRLKAKVAAAKQHAAAQKPAPKKH